MKTRSVFVVERRVPNNSNFIFATSGFDVMSKSRSKSFRGMY